MYRMYQGTFNPIALSRWSSTEADTLLPSSNVAGLPGIRYNIAKRTKEATITTKIIDTNRFAIRIITSCPSSAPRHVGSVAQSFRSHCAGPSCRLGTCTSGHAHSCLSRTNGYSSELRCYAVLIHIVAQCTSSRRPCVRSSRTDVCSSRLAPEGARTEASGASR